MQFYGFRYWSPFLADFWVTCQMTFFPSCKLVWNQVIEEIYHQLEELMVLACLPPVVCYSMFFLLIASVFFFGGVFPFVFPLCFFPFYVVSQYHGWVFLLLPDLQQRTWFTGSWLHWPIPTVGKLMKSVLVLVHVVMRCCSSKTPIETFLSLVGTRSLHP